MGYEKDVVVTRQPSPGRGYAGGGPSFPPFIMDVCVPALAVATLRRGGAYPPPDPRCRSNQAIVSTGRWPASFDITATTSTG